MRTQYRRYCTLSSRAQNNGSSVGPIRRRTDDTDAGFALWNYAKDKEASFYENPVTSASSTLNSVQQDFKEQVALQSGNSPTPYPVTK